MRMQCGSDDDARSEWERISHHKNGGRRHSFGGPRQPWNNNPPPPPPGRFGGHGGGWSGGGGGGSGGGRGGGRGKRQTTNGTEVLGRRYILSCIKRGETELVGESASWVVMCDLCWAWRVLPDDYYPQFINELICDPATEGKCLSGYGSCQGRDGEVEVQRNVGTDATPRWEWEKVKAGVCCECKVLSGSPLANLVTRR